MTDRERLIELIGNYPCMNTAEDRFMESIASDLADYLLANGVIVPPVELGSRHKVYIPIKGTTVVYETKVYGIGIDEDGALVINPKEYPEDVVSINGFNIGKTVFFTKEEAEKALAERIGK